MNYYISMIVVTLAFLYLPSATQTAEMNAVLDLAVHFKTLDTHFARYGYQPNKYIVREDQGLRFYLPAAAKGVVGQTGLYSYVSLAGDFEVSAMYQWLDVPVPQGGHGVRVGIAVDTPDSGGSISLARAFFSSKGNGYAVTRGQKSKSGIKYETSYHPTRAKIGRLVLRREKAEVICLAADGGSESLNELCRVPFTEGSGRPVRLFADNGGSPTLVDARLYQIQLRAEEIAGGVPKRESVNGIGWWVGLSAVFVLVGAMLAIRRKQRRWPWLESD